MPQAMRAGLLTQTYLEAMHITKEKNTYEDAQNNAEDIARVKQLLQNSDGNVYGKLAGSIAPEIYGHEDVKKVLLLMMVGGVTKVMPDGMRLRGDIHVCLMGMHAPAWPRYQREREREREREGGREGRGGRARERKRETEREGKRERERERDTHRDRDTERETGRETERGRERKRARARENALIFGSKRHLIGPSLGR